MSLYINFEGLILPVNKFSIIKGGNEDVKLVTGKNDYLFDFLRFKNEENIVNKLITRADKYVIEGRNSMYKGPIIYLFSNYGLIKAESNAYDKRNECSYLNKLELEEIELPK